MRTGTHRVKSAWTSMCLIVVGYRLFPLFHHPCSLPSQCWVCLNRQEPRPNPCKRSWKSLGVLEVSTVLWQVQPSRTVATSSMEPLDTWVLKYIEVRQLLSYVPHCIFKEHADISSWKVHETQGSSPRSWSHIMILPECFHDQITGNTHAQRHPQTILSGASMLTFRSDVQVGRKGEGRSTRARSCLQYQSHCPNTNGNTTDFLWFSGGNLAIWHSLATFGFTAPKGFPDETEWVSWACEAFGATTAILKSRPGLMKKSQPSSPAFNLTSYQRDLMDCHLWICLYIWEMVESQ